MKGGAVAMEQTSREATITTKQQKTTHAKRHSQPSMRRSDTRHSLYPDMDMHAQVMRLHAVITTAHGSGAPMRVANARGERES